MASSRKIPQKLVGNTKNAIFIVVGLEEGREGWVWLRGRWWYADGPSESPGGI